MNPAGRVIMGVAGGLMALVCVVLILGYLGPNAGSASAGVVSTGNTISGDLPFIGAAMACGIALLALGGTRTN